MSNNYFYKGAPLTSIFASGGSAIPSIQNYYISFPPVVTGNSQNEVGVIQNDLGYKISGQPITQNFPIIAASQTVNSLTGNVSLNVPTWCTSITAVITTKNGNPGPIGTPNNNNPNSVGPQGANITQHVLVGFNCGPLNTQCNRQNNTLNATGGPGGPGGQGGPGGPGGDAVITTINNPYIFNSTLSINVNSTSINLKDGNTTIVTSNYGGSGGPGGPGQKGQPGNTGTLSLTNPQSGHCVSPLGTNFCHTTWPGTRREIPGNTGPAGPTGTTGAIGTAATGNTTLPNISLTNINTSSTNPSVTVYYF